MVAEEQPFLDAILAAPDDDAPRLVFADWLQQRGDPRGELITVQCALERDLPWPEREKLEVRERALVRPAADPLRAIRDGHYTFRRGFADTARLSGHQPLRLGELHELQPLLRSFAVVAGRYDELVLADWVEGVELEHGLFDPDELVSRLPFPKLRRLRLPWAAWSPEGVERVASLDRPLVYLSLDFDVRTTPEHLEALERGLAARRSLRALRLEGARGAGVIRAAGLTHLELVRCDVKREDVLEMSRDLVKLELTESVPRHQGPRVDVAELLEAAPRLAELRLEGAGIDDDEVIRLSRSPHARRLKRLNLMRNRITDYGALELMGSGALDGLVYLNLDVNELSRKTASALRKHYANALVQVR